MNDREQLELAAKAAGYGDVIDHGENHYTVGLHSGMKAWNPLTDDGDALRLAVKLKLSVSVFGAHISISDDEGYETYLRIEGDPYAATRSAIVKAAAEIGKGMA